MNRIATIRTEFVELIPSHLADGVLYVSRKYHTASHLCACGCRNKVVTPLNPSGWQLGARQGKSTLYPSIGNWSFPCQSHYWIRNDRIEWAPKWTREEIETGRQRDRLAQRQFFDGKPDVPLRPTIFQRVLIWLKSIVRK
ncbi:DUF6527 family protein [Bradyrhizobium brasilense]|uniref:DUF6527 family protein n=1 Tax=Bradyrhizobium brasilense TaxID=1419277 RepID=UPI0024B08AC0|nr:DUF6527 family protein [Bradyrhizobium australafricanum]WFU32393.1 DUF6527 family protein [Bradyrhizobium australafricanum]